MIYDIEHINIIGDTFNEDHDKVFDEVFEDIFAGNVTKVPKAYHAVLGSDDGLDRLLAAVIGEYVQQPVSALDHVSTHGCHACDAVPALWRTGLVPSRRPCDGRVVVVFDMPRQLLYHEELHYLLREDDHVVDTHVSVVIRTKRDHFSK